MFDSIHGINTTNTMSFSIFAGLFRLFRFFLKYGVTNPGFLNAEEFAALIADP
jgi:hypothetical protein